MFVVLLWFELVAWLSLSDREARRVERSFLYINVSHAASIDEFTLGGATVLGYVVGQGRQVAEDV